MMVLITFCSFFSSRSDSSESVSLSISPHFLLPLVEGLGGAFSSSDSLSSSSDSPSLDSSLDLCSPSLFFLNMRILVPSRSLTGGGGRGVAAGTTGEMGVTGAGSGSPFFYKRPSIGGIITFLARCWMSLYLITCFFFPSCSSSLRASCSRHHCSLIFMVT